MVRKDASVSDPADVPIGTTLLGGLLLSVGIMGVALVFALLSSRTIAKSVLPLDSVVPRVLTGDINALLDVGILALFASPLAGVIVGLGMFAREKDIVFAVIGVLLLVMLAASFAVALK